MFYELHPQLWGKGIMSEAFTEVLRFAMEEVGVDLMVVSGVTNLILIGWFLVPVKEKPCSRFSLTGTRSTAESCYAMNH
jgi:hypothetical protein